MISYALMALVLTIAWSPAAAFTSSGVGCGMFSNTRLVSAQSTPLASLAARKLKLRDTFGHSHNKSPVDVRVPSMHCVLLLISEQFVTSMTQANDPGAPLTETRQRLVYHGKGFPVPAQTLIVLFCKTLCQRKCLLHGAVYG